MNPTPTVGRIVHTLVDPTRNNGSDIAPAIITRVWSDIPVNLRVLYDGEQVGWVTSATLHPDEQEARQRIVEGVTPLSGHQAFWPRVVR